VYRPALALPLPNPGRSPILLLDVGANVSCRPEHLVQFAHMGSAFAQAVLGIESPRVALLSNGEEPGKGTPELVSVHEQLAGSRGAGLNFVGNVEGLGSHLIAPTMQELQAAIDPEGPGGAYMLGLRQLGVVAHGRFSARGFAQAINVAARGVQQDVIGRTRTALQQAGAMRPPAGHSAPAHDLAGATSEPTATVSRS
jgi:glycerol-3-phosphate acyltransferase PlsX